MRIKSFTLTTALLFGIMLASTVDSAAEGRTMIVTGANGDEIGQRADGVLDWRVGVDAMRLMRRARGAGNGFVMSGPFV